MIEEDKNNYNYAESRPSAQVVCAVLFNCIVML